MPVSEAIRESDAGLIIDFEVTPGSKTICVPSGYNPWRKRIEAKLTEKPQKGKANLQLIQKLSEIFELPSSCISIASGAKKSHKSVLIEGIDRKKAEKLLEKK